ncbi:DUF817 domain-containing protein [Nioella sp.]|uniref:DUF817 domain-containing protein n=1 Tax=Nioella sp. TaxID=1912091 RepID=UPI003A8701FA
MADRGTAFLERRMGDWARARLHPYLAEFIMFVLKQGWAAMFGILFLVAIIGTKAVWQEDWALARYDALFLFAVAVQVAFVWLRLEEWEEVKVIALFHLTGTIMEIFKLAQGSWDYPEQGIFELGGVPLFSGFMYASVGSYIARVIRIFHMEFAPYPPFWTTLLLAGAIYGNFFAHHFLPDIRMGLFLATVLLFWRTRIWFFPGTDPRWLPLPVAAGLAAVFIWIAENVGTVTRTWAYAGQGQFDMVSLGKLGSWYLLLYVSFVTVTLIMRDELKPHPVRPGPREIYRGPQATKPPARATIP